jgi:hypothetical protein
MLRARRSRSHSTPRKLQRASQVRSPFQAGGSKPAATPTRRRRPEWDGTIHDLAVYKLSKEEQVRRRDAAAVTTVCVGCSASAGVCGEREGWPRAGRLAASAVRVTTATIVLWRSLQVAKMVKLISPNNALAFQELERKFGGFKREWLAVSRQRCRCLSVCLSVCLTLMSRCRTSELSDFPDAVTHQVRALSKVGHGDEPRGDASTPRAHVCVSVGFCRTP